MLCEIDAVRKELSERNARSLLQDAGLVIDTFDNSASRRLVQEQCRVLAVEKGRMTPLSEPIFHANPKVASFP